MQNRSANTRRFGFSVSLVKIMFIYILIILHFEIILSIYFVANLIVL